VGHKQKPSGDADPFRHDPTTRRTLADEADAHRYRMAFGHLDEGTLLRAMAGALRAYATPNRQTPAKRSELREEEASAA
jgi:hypothetical protein